MGEIFMKIMHALWSIFFGPLKVSKNTQGSVEKTAYNDKYYHCALILQMKYGAEEPAMIADFSQYNSRRLVMLTTYTPQTREEAIEAQGLEKTLMCERPVLIEKAKIFEVEEGLWSWTQV